MMSDFSGSTGGLALLLVRLLVSLIVLLPIAQANAEVLPEGWPSKIDLVNLLRDRNFGKLSNSLQDLQAAYEDGSGDEKVVSHAFSAFENSDPALLDILTEWTDTHSSHYAPWLALGNYHMAVGWRSRGQAFASKTTKQQMSGMEHHFKRGFEAYNRALSLNSGLTIAYEGMIRGLNGIGARSKSKQVFDYATSIAPTSYRLWNAYLISLQPKWGGSLAEMETALEELREFQNPELNHLLGYKEYVLGDMIGLGKRDAVSCAASLLHLNKALELGENSFFYFERARLHICLNSAAEAYVDLNKALRLSPQDARVYNYLGEVYRLMKDFSGALREFNNAILIDNYYPDALWSRAWIFLGKLEFTKAYHDYRRSKVYDP